jgi:hypothetical protein
MKTLGLLLLATCIGISSCELLEDTGLTTEQVAEGLKTALVVGTDSSSSILSTVNGYYGDAAVKILLPPEADGILDAMNEIGAVKTLMEPVIDNVVKTVNRAAEDAAVEAAPIFKNAITSMSFSDAWAILKGSNPANPKKSTEFDSLAATHYLISTTYDALSAAFSPKIDVSLNKDLLGSVSANDAWNTFETKYNSVAENAGYQLILSIAGINMDPVPSSLGAYATERALDGLFLKVGEQERSIRENPLKWAATTVGNILEKVFGN